MPRGLRKYKQKQKLNLNCIFIRMVLRCECKNLKIAKKISNLGEIVADDDDNEKSNF